VLEFTSARKRMSVVVREPKSGRIRMIIKGADSAIFPLLATGQDDILRATERHLEDHANDGLRTLLLAQKSLDEATYTDWARRYRAALTDLAELEKKEKELPNLIEKTMGELEHGLLLVGSTAIEDKLQDGVPQRSPIWGVRVSPCGCSREIRRRQRSTSPLHASSSTRVPPSWYSISRATPQQKKCLPS